MHYAGRRPSPLSQSQALLPTYMSMPVSPSLCQGRKEEKKKPRGLYPLIKHSPDSRQASLMAAPCTIDLRPDTSAPTMGHRPSGQIWPPPGGRAISSSGTPRQQTIP
ncbi:hypothetical protein MUG91_G18n92 [Manis pentadactyla]|nr:hypothetical protein MUG91_G18n92 [Manis pentadactyla]